MLTPLHATLRRWALVLAVLAVAGAMVATATSAHAATELPALGESSEHAKTCLLLSLVCGVGAAGAFALQAARSHRRHRWRGPRIALPVDHSRAWGAAARTLTLARPPSPPDLCRFLT